MPIRNTDCFAFAHQDSSWVNGIRSHTYSRAARVSQQFKKECIPRGLVTSANGPSGQRGVIKVAIRPPQQPALVNAEPSRAQVESRSLCKKNAPILKECRSTLRTFVPPHKYFKQEEYVSIM